MFPVILKYINVFCLKDIQQETIPFIISMVGKIPIMLIIAVFWKHISSFITEFLGLPMEE
jgi:hypothetical protein